MNINLPAQVHPHTRYAAITAAYREGRDTWTLKFLRIAEVQRTAANFGESRSVVLIDTGTGGKLEHDPAFHDTGRLMANLRAAQYRPERVDEIYITHFGEESLHTPRAIIN